MKDKLQDLTPAGSAVPDVSAETEADLYNAFTNYTAYKAKLSEAEQETLKASENTLINNELTQRAWIEPGFFITGSTDSQSPALKFFSKADNYNKGYYLDLFTANKTWNTYNELITETLQENETVFITDKLGDALALMQETESYKGQKTLLNLPDLDLKMLSELKIRAVYIGAINNYRKLEKTAQSLNNSDLELYYTNLIINPNLELAHRPLNFEFNVRTIQRDYKTLDPDLADVLAETENNFAAEYEKDLQNRHKGLKTGLKSLDKVLNGGIKDKLNVIAAPPGTGKTALVLQIADYIASNGTPVIYYSLEMSKTSLRNRAIARNTYILGMTKKGYEKAYKSSEQIFPESEYNRYTSAARELVENAKNKYFTEAGQNLFLVAEPSTVKDIETKIKKVKRATGKTPAVIIDFFQLLNRPDGDRLTVRRDIIDANIKELKAVLIKYNTPIIAISNLTKESEKEAENGGGVQLTGLKESAELGYTAEIVLSLEKVKELPGHKRHIRVRVLKNREGEAGGKLDLSFYPAYGYFEELDPHRIEPDYIPDLGQPENPFET